MEHNLPVARSEYAEIQAERCIDQPATETAPRISDVNGGITAIAVGVACLGLDQWNRVRHIVLYVFVGFLYIEAMHQFIPLGFIEYVRVHKGTVGPHKPKPQVMSVAAFERTDVDHNILLVVVAYQDVV